MKAAEIRKRLDDLDREALPVVTQGREKRRADKEKVSAAVSRGADRKRVRAAINAGRASGVSPHGAHEEVFERDARESLRKHRTPSARSAPHGLGKTRKAARERRRTRALNARAACNVRSRYMPDSDDDLLRQAERDLAELYPTPEAWERSYPLLDPPDDPEKRAQYDDLRDMYPEREDQTSVNALQKARFEKAIQKATVSREVSHHNPLPVTQDRVRDSIARATQERAQDVMKAREYAASMRDPLHQRSVGRVSPTNGLPPMDKSRQSVQDSAPKKVDLDRD